MGKLKPQQNGEVSSMWFGIFGPIFVSIYSSNNNFHIGGS